jgi:3-isopropylmalate/(R)-2-methylmalate dehydratase small subunit
MALVCQGRVWKFGDSINTDLIFPNRAFRLPQAEQFKLVFSANRPGWVDQVSQGDLVIAGSDFGMGSGRPVGRLLAECGIGGLLATSINGLCLRNCLTFGFPALAVAGILNLFAEGDVARVDYGTGQIDNLTSGRSMTAEPLPQLFRDLIIGGGSIAMLVREGWIESEPHHVPGALTC